MAAGRLLLAEWGGRHSSAIPASSFRDLLHSSKARRAFLPLQSQVPPLLSSPPLPCAVDSSNQQHTATGSSGAQNPESPSASPSFRALGPLSGPRNESRYKPREFVPNSCARDAISTFSGWPRSVDLRDVQHSLVDVDGDLSLLGPKPAFSRQIRVPVPGNAASGRRPSVTTVRNGQLSALLHHVSTMPGGHEQYANPLLLDWVKEWLDTARERGMKSVTTYKNAYESLKACPITFKHPRQLVQLRGFGDKLSSRLTDKLKEHCEANGLPMPKNPRLSKEDRAYLGGATDDDETAPPPKKARKAKPYVPTYRSGAYALVLALSTLDVDASLGMTKAKLIELAQEHCDSSFTAPSDPTKFHTAWNSMKTLVEKDLVCEKGRPQRRYSLTDDGWEVAKRIKRTTEPSGQADDVVAGPSSRTEHARPDPDISPIPVDREASQSVEPVELQPKPKSAYEGVVANGPEGSDDALIPTFTPIRLAPGSFTVHLALDIREVRALKDRDYMQEELTKKGVKPIMRALEIGDAQWIAKCHDPAALSRQGGEGDEVVLDWIVERKRLDDLVSSVKDGRFHEQKFRLRKSGVKNVVYIVEEITMDSGYFQRVEEMIQSAIASTQVVNGYFLKKTQKMDDTIRYLARMTLMLKKMYESKPLLVIPTTVLTAQNYLPMLQHLREKDPTKGYYITYPAFASLASKSDMMTLRDIYLKMLMTTRGITGEKALEIQKRWKTPHDLIKAFEECGSGEQGTKRKREMVISGLPNLVGRKKIPKAVSQRLAEVWGDA